MNNSSFIYPWGPLLFKQTMEPSDLKYYLDNLNDTFNIDMDNYFGKVRRKEYNGNLKFRKLFSPYIKNYLKEDGMYGAGFYISAFWINIYENNSFVPPHTHNGCDLSFVFFLKVPPKESLNDPNEGNVCFTYGDPQHTSIKTKKIWIHRISSKVGEIYIFPRNLNQYTIPISDPKLVRISVSGNILLK